METYWESRRVNV